MSGKYLITIHKCVLPELNPSFGPGTQWRCDCRKVWEIIDMFSEDTWQTYEYALLIKCRRANMKNKTIFKLYPETINAERTRKP